MPIEKIVEAALGSVRADGKSPTWGAEEQGILLQNLSRMRVQFEERRRQETERLSQDNMGKLFPQVIAGSLRIDATYIQKLQALGPYQGGVNDRDARQLFEMQNAVDARKRGDIDAARSAISFAHSQQQFAWAQQSHSREMQTQHDQDSMNSLMAKFWTGGVSPSQAISSLDRDYKAGLYDDKLYVTARSTFMSMPAPSKLLTMHDAQQYRQLLLADQRGVAQDVASRMKGTWSPTDFARKRNESDVIFFNTLRTSGDPAEALTRSLEHLGGKPDYIKRRVSSAGAMTTKPSQFQRLQDQSADMALSRNTTP